LAATTTTARLDRSGPFLQHLLGGNGTISNGVAVDSSGHAFVVGTTHITNFLKHQLLHTGGEDAFVTKFNASGTESFTPRKSAVRR